VKRGGGGAAGAPGFWCGHTQSQLQQWLLVRVACMHRPSIMCFCVTLGCCPAERKAGGAVGPLARCDGSTQSLSRSRSLACAAQVWTQCCVLLHNTGLLPRQEGVGGAGGPLGRHRGCGMRLQSPSSSWFRHPVPMGDAGPSRPSHRGWWPSVVLASWQQSHGVAVSWWWVHTIAVLHMHWSNIARFCATLGRCPTKMGVGDADSTPRSSWWLHAIVGGRPRSCWCRGGSLMQPCWSWHVSH
jgi:hypothetical protein